MASAAVIEHRQPRCDRQRGRLVVMFRRLRSLLRFACFVLLVVPALVPASRAASAYEAVRLFGVDYVDLRDVGRRFGLAPQWITARDTLRLRSSWTTLEFTVRRVEARLNGVTVFLSEPVVARLGSLYIARNDAERLFAPILVPRLGPRISPLRTVMIDPGHGGRDPGNQNLRLRLHEKTFTLDVARRLSGLLTAAGFRVVMTRTRDRYVSLEERAALADRHRPDLFISLHFNAFSDRTVSGVETFVMTPLRDRSTPQRERDLEMLRTRFPGNAHDHWNAVIGYQMHRALVMGTHAEDRGLKRFRFSVLRSVACPAVLVEAGFLSNDAEGRRVADPAHRQRIAEAIATAVKAHRSTRQGASRG